METIIAAILLLGILIFVHELGHFLVAKKTGVEVEKFSIGFGRKLISKKIGETEYILSLIPLGGYVKMVGEEISDEPIANPERSFANKSVFARLGIVAAGPLFNIIFAVILFSIVYMAGIGVPSELSFVGTTKEGAPAMKAGLQKGDRIIEIDSKKIETWLEMADIIHDSSNKNIEFKVKRGEEIFIVNITPIAEKLKGIDGKEKEMGLIGVQPLMEKKHFGVIESIKMGFLKTWQVIYLTFWGIHKMIVGEISSKNLGGPILIFQQAGAFASEGFSAYVGFAAVISVNLGILNLLPIPILDGGHILFFLLELILHKPISIKIRENAQKVGIALLLSLMIFAFYNDIMRFFE